VTEPEVVRVTPGREGGSPSTRSSGLDRPSSLWRTFLSNHGADIAAMDLFVVPTVGFGLLYVLVIIRLARREFVRINVTASPTAK
jgi:hypothetical protein